MADAEAPPPWDDAVADRPETRHTCHLTTFRRTRSNRLGVGMSPKNFADAEAPLLGTGGGADP